MDEQSWLQEQNPNRLLRYLTHFYTGNGISESFEHEPQDPRISERKVRLFAAACCRRLWDSLPDARSRRAVEVAERYADGEASEEELKAANSAAVAAILTSDWGGPVYCADRASDLRLSSHGLLLNLLGNAEYGLEEDCERRSRMAEFADLVREIAGNPFAPVWLPRPVCPRCVGTGVNPPGRRKPKTSKAAKATPCDRCGGRCPWLTPTVLDIARSAYDNRDPSTGHLDPVRLAVLADALEEAGCEDERLLQHLRGYERCGRTLSSPVPWKSCEPHVRGCWVLDLVLGKK